MSGRVTEVPSDSTVAEEIKSTLYQIITESLQTLIYDEVHRDCEGCQVDHPSQRRHQLCLFTSTDEWVDVYLDTALEKIDMDEVMERWYPQIDLIAVTDKNWQMAFHLWQDIKKEFRAQLSDEACKYQWGRRVKNAWDH